MEVDLDRRCVVKSAFAVAGSRFRYVGGITGDWVRIFFPCVCVCGGGVWGGRWGEGKRKGEGEGGRGKVIGGGGGEGGEEE